jgi:hypothetical protein
LFEAARIPLRAAGESKWNRSEDCPMLRVCVTVSNEQNAPSFDLEVPAEVPAMQLERLIAHSLQWDVDSNGLALRHSIFADPPGRVLGTQETLADAKVWDGSSLKFETFVSAWFAAPSGACHPLHRSEVVLGRGAPEQADDAQINLVAEPGSKTVSRQHALVTFAKGQWQITHLSDVNQTVLNGHALDGDDRLTLGNGDRVELAAVELIFHLGDPPAEPLLRLEPLLAV